MPFTPTAVPTPTLPKATPGMLQSPVNAANTVAANAPNANATTVQQNQQLGTVEGRTASIIDANSPLMQRARAKANEIANSRGLRNSSMAVGAAQNAVIDTAAPIATRDASSYNNFELANQNAQNTMERMNVGNKQQTSLANADIENRTSLSNARQENAINIKQATNDQQANLFNAQQQNKVVLDQLDQNNKVELANIQAQYKNEMQANVTTSRLFSDTMSALNNIQQNKYMNSTTKQNSIDQMVSMLKTGMNVAGSISNLNLGGLLDFSGLPAAA